MSSKANLTTVKGVHDVTPDRSALWRYVEQTALEVFELYNFREIRTPAFERTAVFSRSIGETSDIVEKEMYTFTDRGGESLTLRPEGTAAVVRAYIEHQLYNPPGVVKVCYQGPMFRAERPQAGRFRQFHQIGAEVFGSADPAVDAELIIMLMDLFTELKVGDLKIVLNSLGCPACRPAYREALHAYLDAHRDQLCTNCDKRIDRNPLRALDCKSDGCRKVAAGAPTIDQHLCADCRDHFDKVRRPLLDLELPVTIDPSLVRGLDYYTRTAFEIVSDRLGAQSSVVGGGRYDGLVEEFGGPATPAIGFALGIERLLTLVPGEVREEAGDLVPDVYFILMTDEARARAFELAHRLRSYGFRVERGFDGGSMKSQMRKADRSGARFVVIIGGDEMDAGAATVKDMREGTQRQVPFSDLIDALDDVFEEEGPPPGEEGDSL